MLIGQKSLADALDDGRQSATAQRVAKGVRRMLRARNCASVTELVLPDGRRADIMALAADGTLTIIEIKSCVADMRADGKWPFYRHHCDHLFFAIPPDVPQDIIPGDAGLIIADGFAAEILRDAPAHRLAGATRRSLLIRFAQAAADRLHAASDPGARQPT